MQFLSGAQLALVAGVDLKNYQSVVTWCETFGVLISPADLTASKS
jgi:hypothetical protein